MYGSAVICYRSRIPLQFSFGDTPYLFGDRRASPPSWQSLCYRCCTCCCASSGHGAVYRLLGLEPRLFYGLRHSALIHRSGVRKVVVVGGSGCDGDWDTECGLGGEVLGGYGGSSLGFGREGRDGGRRRKVKRVVLGRERGGDRFSGIESEEEAVISLLSEEVGEESLCWRERGRVSRDMTQIRKERNDTGVHSKGMRQRLGTSIGKNERRCKAELIEINAKDRDGTKERGRGREVFSGRENSGTRREGSCCSSYHSVLSSGDYEDDAEEVKRDEFSSEALGGYGEDTRKAVERKMTKEILEDYKQYKEEEKRGKVIRKARESETSFVDWDRRKKSEKKPIDFSLNEVESSLKSVQEQSTMSRTSGREDAGPSSFHVQVRGGGQKSTAGMSVDSRTENLHKHKETEVRIVNEPIKTCKEAAEHCRFCGSNVSLLSQTERQQQITRKEDVVVSEALVAERINERDGKKAVMTEREKFFRKPHELSVELDARETDSEKNADSSRSSRARLNSAAVVEEKQKRRFGMNEMVHREEQSGKSEELSEYMESHYSFQRTSFPQPGETKSSRQESKFAPNMTENQIIESPLRLSEIQTIKHSGEESSAVINQSIVHSADMRSFDGCRRISNETTMNNGNFTSIVALAGEAQKKNSQIGGRVTSIESKIGQDSVDQPSSPGGIRSETSTHQDFDLIRQNIAGNTDRRDKTPSQSLLIPPLSQLVQREHSTLGRTHARDSQEGHYVLNSDSLITYEGASDPSLHFGYASGQLNYGRDDQSEVLTTEGAALESAIRTDEAARQFLGEFMEQTKIAANSDMHVSDSTLDGKTRFDGNTSLSEIVPESSPVEAPNERDLSEGPGTKYPFGDIWHDTNTSIQEIPNSESPEEVTESGTTIVKRSGGTLWKIIGDLFRLRWGIARSAVRSGGRDSSNMSVGSETWFSGHEAEENIDIIAKRGSKNKPPEAAAKQPQPALTLTGDQVDTQLSNQEELFKTVISPPSVTKSDSPSSSDKGCTLNKDNFMSSPVAAGLLESSLSRPEKGMTASLVTASSSGEVNVYGSGSPPGSDESSNMLVEAIATKGKNGELKHRKKLQRKQQLPKDRFDEWEEACQLELEQRRIDEMFMREALLEAKKASDNWEVPVGAVLVQHGKIIARGCNLVEELRDSTAHAEMICIREASNVLKSWRLSETTLYVTLEPCTMCAGAILQARVDTLVWGAPNTLLGADGSFVRLFPVREEDGGSGATDKPAPPVHPFHPKMTVRRGVLASECGDMMQQFFQLRRRKEKKGEPTMPPAGRSIIHPRSKLLDKMHHIFHFLFCLQ